MKNPIRALTLSLFAGAAFAAASAQAMQHPRTAADYGSVVMNAGSGRTIDIDENTRYVNVKNGETVRFNVNGQSFSFNFDAWPNEESVALSTIAPAGVAVPNVQVYIAANPLYQD
jgi:hypothetical protein